MNVQSPIQVRFQEDSAATIACRLTDAPTAPNTEGPLFVKADLTAIALSVINTTTNVAVTNFSALALTVASVFFDTLQGWWYDSTGCNFMYTVSHLAFPDPNQEYRVSVKWTFADGTQSHSRWIGVAERVY